MPTMVGKFVSINNKNNHTIVLFRSRRYVYLCNDTAITSASKLHDFRCKFANVRMVMKHNEQRTE